MLKEPSDSQRGNLLAPLHVYSFRLAARVLLYATSHRIAHTMAFVPSVVEHWLEQEITQLVHHE